MAAYWELCVFEPLDVVANTGTRSIEAGGFGVAGQPSSAAFAGVLRTAMLRQAGFPFSDPSVATLDQAAVANDVGFEGEPPDTGFAFQGPFYWSEASSGTLVLPSPALHLREKGSGVRTYRAGARSGVADSGLSGARLLVPLVPPSADVEPDTRGLTLEALCNTLSGSDPKSPRLHLGHQRDGDALFATERRFGHQRSALGAVLDKGLFSFSTQRFRDRVFVSGGVGTSKVHGYAGLIRSDSTSYLRAGLLTRVGAEGRIARLSVSSADGHLNPVKKLGDVIRQHLQTATPPIHLLLYLATPAIFQHGWRPGVTSTLKLVAAAVGRPVTISGWKLTRSRGEPKPVRRAAPAGSCYLFEVEEGQRQTAADLVSRYHFNESVSDEQRGLGFGSALFGLW